MRLNGERGAETTLPPIPISSNPAMLRRRLSFWCGLLFVLAARTSARAQIALPDAPLPRTNLIAGDSLGSAALAQQTFPPEARHPSRRTLPGLQPSYVPLPRPCSMHACSQLSPPRSCCQAGMQDYSFYLSQNATPVYTPKKLAALAWRGVADPFNLLTIGGTSFLSVAGDSHSPYGPGFDGWARLSGVTLTEDMTGEFVGTFMIPSIDHQDPHYHPWPNASLMRRTLHCMYQPFWTVSDTGHSMPNYSTIVGSMIEEAVNVTYVPYQRTGWGPSAERIASNWATAPVGNLVTEFVPEVARHININIVFLQRIINQVAIEEGAGPGSVPP